MSRINFERQPRLNLKMNEVNSTFEKKAVAKAVAPDSSSYLFIRKTAGKIIKFDKSLVIPGRAPKGLRYLLKESVNASIFVGA
jgi:hypothetical protein